jgi:hypothetical protein
VKTKREREREREKKQKRKERKIWRLKHQESKVEESTAGESIKSASIVEMKIGNLICHKKSVTIYGNLSLDH